MKILFAASEVSPLVKVGGLADVVGALPLALHDLGHEARVIIPKYGVMPIEKIVRPQLVAQTSFKWQGHQIEATVEESHLPDSSVVLYLLSAPKMFTEGAVYYEHFGPGGIRHSLERYLFFSRAVSQFIPLLDWAPDIIHCHDWHAATIPLQLQLSHQSYPTVLTIHNLEGQGKWRADEVFSWLGLRGDESPALAWRDAGGDFNALQQGIRSATSVNTVSPTYAQEILTKKYGVGLEADLRQRPGRVMGILNGIDYRAFNPATDPLITRRYSAEDVDQGKRLNRQALYQELKLEPSTGPLFGFIARLTPQKGVSLVLEAIPEIIKRGGQLIILGSGRPEIEQLVSRAGADHPGRVSSVVGFDAALAQHIYAASDFFLMPSIFEPCGLGQMIAMRYGSLPVVHDTGGLHDTVRDMAKRRRGTGFIFTKPTAKSLCQTIAAAVQWMSRPGMITAARRRAMQEDFSWHHSARAYLDLYAASQKQ